MATHYGPILPPGTPRDGGEFFRVPQEMQDILDRPGIQNGDPGLRLLKLYSQTSLSYDPKRLSDFGFACFLGELEWIRTAFEKDDAPPMGDTETCFRWGYLTLVVTGSQRVSFTGNQGEKVPLQHDKVIHLLIEKGAPVNAGDICGLTPIHHCTTNAVNPGVLRALLEGGADPNARDRYGHVALHGAFMAKQVSTIDLLMEFGADINIEDGDKVTPKSMLRGTSPEMQSIVAKWLRVRSGEEPALLEHKDACSQCGTENSKLRACSRCRTVRYCSRECQGAHWPTHKVNCKRISAGNTLHFNPRYEKYTSIYSNHDMIHAMLGNYHQGSAKVFSRVDGSEQGSEQGNINKSMVVKVQVSSDGDGILVYSKGKKFLCELDPQDGPQAYQQLVGTIEKKGFLGKKAYFTAELLEDGRLAIKVGEVLALQPW